MVETRTNYKEALDEFLTCFICNSRYNTVGRRPLALFCGHTFCSACVPHFKQVFGQLNCPIDHINEVRPAAQIPNNEHLLQLVTTMEIKCLFHPDKPADYYTKKSCEPVCEDCEPCFASQGSMELRELTFPGFLLEKIETMRAQVSSRLGRYPQISAQLANVRDMLNNDKQRLLAALQNIAAGLDPNTPKQRPEQAKPKVEAPSYYTLLDNGIYEIKRFHRVVPQPTQATEEAKQWWISNTGRQVDALVVSPTVPINLVGIALCKEVVINAAVRIDYVDILQGTSTQGRAIVRVAQNLAYSGPDPQLMTLMFQKCVPLKQNEKITIKVKVTGRGLYYGDPSARIEPLTGPGGMVFHFDDPVYEGGDFQNGQSKWAGPIIKLYFSFPPR